MSTTITAGNQQMAALADIHVAGNVRDLDADHVRALAGSIRLQGILVPVVVRPADPATTPAGVTFELVAGFHRVAAAAEIGLREVPVVVRDADRETAAATENIARKALNAHEEARAVRAMLDQGLSADGAAQALGWPKARVTARVKLLELPERAQVMIGAGEIPVSAVDQLRAIGAVSPALLDAVIAFLADGNQWAAERLAREPGWVLDSALRQGNVKVSAVHLASVDAPEIAALRLGKKTEALYEQAPGLHKQLDRYSYGSAEVRFSDAEVDQARAAGVVIEFDRARPVIVDRALYRELVKQAIARTVTDLQVRVAQRAGEKRSGRHTAGRDEDQTVQALRDHRRAVREIAEQAHGVNLDVGAGLLTGLSVIDAAQDMNVAWFFVGALFGADYDSSPYTQTGERIARLAVSGIRLVIDEFRADATRTLKSGERGRLRIDYGNAREPERVVVWIWRYLQQARTPSELYGRALVVVCAEKYASRLVLPTSQQHLPTRWSSHGDRAEKALAKLVGPHLPSSLRALEKAVARADGDYNAANQAAANHRARSGADTHPGDEEPTEHAEGAEVDGTGDSEDELDAPEEAGDAE